MFPMLSENILRCLETCDYVYIIVFSVFLGIYVWRWISLARNLPPGPYNLPVVGYLPFLDIKMELVYKKLSEKFGDVFGLKLGQRYVVVLTSWEAVKEAFIDKGSEFAGRPKPFSVIGWALDYKAMLTCDGMLFQEQKRFILRSLRQLGFGKNSIVTSIQDEAEVVINLFRDHNGTMDDIHTIFNTITTNIICSVAFGKRFDHGEEKLKKILELFHSMAMVVQEVLLFEAFPFLRFLPSWISGWNKIETIKGNLYGIIDEIIEEHINNFDPNNPRDLIDYYLKSLQEKELIVNDENSGSLFSRSYIRSNMSLLFFAGTETSANVLTFAIKFLIMHPEIQQKVQEEIDRVIGRSRLPTWTDKESLTYTSATILEIHRCSSIVHVTPFHTNPEKAVLKGFTIPKESYIQVNLWQIHHDRSLWKDPEKFDPTRFINENGKIEKPDYLIPFSAGRRICIGETLANMEIFIFLTSLLQNFTFAPGDEQSKEFVICHGLLRKLAPFKVKVECR